MRKEEGDTEIAIDLVVRLCVCPTQCQLISVDVSRPKPCALSGTGLHCLIHWHPPSLPPSPSSISIYPHQFIVNAFISLKAFSVVLSLLLSLPLTS